VICGGYVVAVVVVVDRDTRALEGVVAFGSPIPPRTSFRANSALSAVVRTPVRWFCGRDYKYGGYRNAIAASVVAVEYTPAPPAAEPAEPPAKRRQ
jgi:hypothetical protein